MSEAADQQDALGARVAALELLVEQLILERVQQTEDPKGTLFMAMQGLADTAASRGEPQAPEAVDALRQVLARVMKRLGEG